MNKLPSKDFSHQDLARWLGMDAQSVKQDLYRHYHLTLGHDDKNAGNLYLFLAAALALRDRLVERWRESRQSRFNKDTKRVGYLSLEFLMGRAFTNTVLNLDMEASVREALAEFGVEMEELGAEEVDAGLGNGGLGRLAACFLDSCATMNLPVTGYGVLYDFGMFQQKIKDGRQIEQPDKWRRYFNPWLQKAPQSSCVVKFYGYTNIDVDSNGKRHVRWLDANEVLAVPYDMPIPGYRNDRVNTLRLWSAEATEEFDLHEFNAGSYPEAVAAKISAEQISMVLYPNDVSENGKVLRLRQQYFLTSASLQDTLSSWVDLHGLNFDKFADLNCFQLNDTHPAIAIAELMRLLVDDYALPWDQSWQITTTTMAYTNHTLLPEALERWSVSMFRNLLPRPLEIIHEINARFLEEVAGKWPGAKDKLAALSIIEGHSNPQIRMAHLAIVGSFSVNGVAALHTKLLKEGLFKDFYELWPEKFNNKTNGVTPRRWLAFCNPKLADLLNETIGTSWCTNLHELERLKPLADDEDFQRKWMSVHQANKVRLAELVELETGVQFEPDMLFDVQVKRIHEYKRQLLNVLHVIYLYHRILNDDTDGLAPRCVLFGGKAAPGYFMAKLIIKLINNVAELVNANARTRGLLRVAFVPNYRVSTMEVICAGTDLSEQISTAGKEASGTGNMKFMMNGALTIGTLDGANIEMREAVGPEHFFLCGLTADEVVDARKSYDPGKIIAEDTDLSAVIDMLESGYFSGEEADLFTPVVDAIRSPDDPWMTAADFRSFVEAQLKVSQLFFDQQQWTKKSILNTAASGRFSSDRTIAQYAREIWKLDVDQT
jgi:starch phosphorylase